MTIKDSALYRLLDQPWVYRLSQFLLAPGANNAITRKIERLLTQLPPAQHILDVGCGPSSWLWKAGLHPIGIDMAFSYTKAFSQLGETAVAGSAAALPFREQSFDAVWNFGLLHHLPDDMARQAVLETVRVCRPSGYIVIIDAVLPDPVWCRPLAYVQRRADRGRFVRRESELKMILPPDKSFTTERFTYTYNGLELLICWSQLGKISVQKSQRYKRSIG
jgi:SAM-dependent methyltransferase